MKTWYYVEDSGNLLTLISAEGDPWGIVSGSGQWFQTVAEAVEYRRKTILRGGYSPWELAEFERRIAVDRLVSEPGDQTP